MYRIKSRRYCYRSWNLRSWGMSLISRAFATARIKSALPIIPLFLSLLGLFATSLAQAGITPVYEMEAVFGPASDTDGSYSLNWSWLYYNPDNTSNTPPTEARIEESQNGGSYVLLATTTGSGTSYALSNRSSGTYTYRVKVCGAG